MKSVLKRRKHRKGIRPVRKGTLKVHMITLPTYDEHRQAITSLMVRQDKFASLDDALKHFNNGNKIEFGRIMSMSKAYSVLIGLMQKGYDYFREHRQIATIDLALNVINNVDPVYAKNETMDEKCSRCTYNSECPLKRYTQRLRSKICCMTIEPSTHELTTAEMAALALTHLS